MVSPQLPSNSCMFASTLSKNYAWLCIIHGSNQSRFHRQIIVFSVSVFKIRGNIAGNKSFLRNVAVLWYSIDKSVYFLSCIIHQNFYASLLPLGPYLFYLCVFSRNSVFFCESHNTDAYIRLHTRMHTQPLQTYTRNPVPWAHSKDWAGRQILEIDEVTIDVSLDGHTSYHWDNNAVKSLNKSRKIWIEDSKPWSVF